MTGLTLVSIAIPAYNEADNLEELFQRLGDVFKSCSEEFDFEVVICENGSTDNSYELLVNHARKDRRIRIVRLSRNFHMEGGMMAALAHVRGDVCVIMSADLQDPPEMIPKMLACWRSGFDHVYTIIDYRHGESRFRRIAAEVFYWLIDRLSDTPVPRNASDFRLVSKPMYQVFNTMPEKVRMVRSIWGWIGFTSTSLRYERPARRRGVSSFRPLVTLGFAVRGLLASSLTPLKLVPIFGFCLSTISFLGLFVAVLRAVFFGVPFAGFGTIIATILLMFGLLFLLLGLLAEYVGMIYVESRSRPPYVVRDVFGT
jgi:glycosyltransferase involved in cell wall biosynthesis